MVRVGVEKPKLVVAGPGAGKTYNMVSRILKEIPSLNPCRYLAAITFTNAATINIRNRIHGAVYPGPSIFIGTIHSFVNQFIIAPFARPLNKLPNDRIFAAVEVDDRMSGGAGRKLTAAGRNAVRQAITRKLLNSGVVPYGEMIRLARELLDNRAVLERVCYRLQFLFIDEFQDVDLGQLEIFERLRKGGRTRIFAVGDPEQFIYSFTYRGKKPPKFENIPFFRFREHAESECMDVNRRSCREIVDFTNRFREEPKQSSGIGPRNEPRVLFLRYTRLDQILQDFRRRAELIPEQRGEIKRLCLGYKNSAFDEIRDHFGLRHLSNGARQRQTILQDALELLALCAGIPQSRVREGLQITDHEWRKWGVTGLRELRDNPALNAEQFLNGWLPKLGIASGLREREKAVFEAFNHLRAAVATGRHDLNGDWSCSIHRSKGLESNAVLVVAEGLNELKKWCVTSRPQRNDDSSDKCRLGFVAFSRAMELLCIACREPLDSELRKSLENLGVTICVADDGPASVSRGR
jgi:DNA helicase-2/ATP-dependent DNA helicase PcrA